ncbi:hypothetical protein KKI93_21580 [Xenorhabdus bovienii]|uniref:endonuclease/exonuclease/phosphatase family protein n=1 Tax=Xenorhabdus bovienii TaxID=40576 RepID=UPI0023B2D5B2|nr:endonuclease/exonuclease/phosphatase family protein [Xenorhabdus bovienii]MDE9566542.1 hypothetical protein [Xenorhabdus bovienii]
MVPELTILEQNGYRNKTKKKCNKNTFRLGAWNLERCKFIDESAEIIQHAGCDIIFATEMDVGMARSGNQHSPAKLAEKLGLGYTFAIEFIEIGAGNQFEEITFAESSNTHALHGNAIISSQLLKNPRLIWLEEEGGSWFSLDWHHRRVGGRNAIAGTLELGEHTITVVVVHLESLPPAERRAEQVQKLLQALDQFSEEPIVIAGDFNTSQLPPQIGPRDKYPDWFIKPWNYEPLFKELHEAGFEWIPANSPEHTRRDLPTGFVKPPFRRADWFFVRGIEASNPLVWPACGPGGHVLNS